MFCSECGKKIDDDAKFCPECGAITESSQSKITIIMKTSQNTY